MQRPVSLFKLTLGKQWQTLTYENVLLKIIKNRREEILPINIVYIGVHVLHYLLRLMLTP